MSNALQAATNSYSAPGGGIGSAIGSGVGTAASDVYTPVASGISSLWNALPSVSGTPSAGAVNPSTNLSTGAVPMSAPGTNGAPTAAQLSPSLPSYVGANEVTGVSPQSGGPNPTGATPSAGGSGQPGTNTNATNMGLLLSSIGKAIDSYQKYQLQQNLQNPNYIKGQIAKLQQPLSASLQGAIGAQTQAQMQEAGLGEAPGLFKQALAQALAPYQYNQEQQAASEYENSIRASQAEDPWGQLGDFGGQLAQLYAQA